MTERTMSSDEPSMFRIRPIVMGGIEGWKVRVRPRKMKLRRPEVLRRLGAKRMRMPRSYMGWPGMPGWFRRSSRSPGHSPNHSPTPSLYSSASNSIPFNNTTPNALNAKINVIASTQESRARRAGASPMRAVMVGAEAAYNSAKSAGMKAGDAVVVAAHTAASSVRSNTTTNKETLLTKQVRMAAKTAEYFAKEKLRANPTQVATVVARARDEALMRNAIRLYAENVMRKHANFDVLKARDYVRQIAKKCSDGLPCNPSKTFISKELRQFIGELNRKTPSVSPPQTPATSAEGPAPGSTSTNSRTSNNSSHQKISEAQFNSTFRTIETLTDGNCLFDAVIKAGSFNMPIQDLRKRAVKEVVSKARAGDELMKTLLEDKPERFGNVGIVKQNGTININLYETHMMKDTVWGGTPEIEGIAEVVKRPILVWQPFRDPRSTETYYQTVFRAPGGFSQDTRINWRKTIHLHYDGQTHYKALKLIKRN